MDKGVQASLAIWTSVPRFTNAESCVFYCSVGLEDSAQGALLRSMETTVGNVADYKHSHTKVCDIPFNAANKIYVSMIFEWWHIISVLFAYLV